MAEVASDDPFAAAQKAKDQGNKFFSERNYAKALAAYTEAIDLSEGEEEDSLDSLDGVQPRAKNPNVQIYYANRAFCHIKMENFGSALIDSTKAIEAKEDFPKGWYRRGSANFALNRLPDALRDLTQLCKLCPNDPDARAKLKATKQKIQQEKFAKAIGCEATQPVSQVVDVDAMNVDSSYKGPVYKSGEVTPEFCKDLMAWQKDQKTLAKKYAYGMVMDMIKLLRRVETLSDVSVPEEGEITVCGDVHGRQWKPELAQQHRLTACNDGCDQDQDGLAQSQILCPHPTRCWSLAHARYRK